MKYEEFTRNLGKAGLTSKSFADLLKYNRNSITNLSKKDEIPKHLAIIAVLLGELKDEGVDFKPLIEKIGLQSLKTRGKDIQKSLKDL